MNTLRLLVTLRQAVPAVTRVIDVPASSTLPELHNLLQAGVGWTDSHLHQFIAGETRYGVPDEDAWDSQEIDESTVKLTDLPPAFTYLYDFGDSWLHDVEVQGPGDEQPGCREGTGVCPPEDSGGLTAYQELSSARDDPSQTDGQHLMFWESELRDFDLTRTDSLVRRTVGQVPESVRLVLDLTEPGVKLTPGGRLPRSLVREVQLARPHWFPLGRPASKEEDLVPLMALHGLLRDAGLLRLAKGVLRPTKIAGADLEVVRRLRLWFGRNAFIDMLAGDVVANLIVHGPQRTNELASRIYPELDQWAVDGEPITELDVRSEISYLLPVLQGLDQVEADGGTWRAGPSADSLLVRAVGLAEIWG